MRGNAKITMRIREALCDLRMVVKVSPHWSWMITWKTYRKVWK